MNWEAISALAEVVGVIAIVVSLIYVAIQIRTQIRESRIAAMHEIAEAYRDAMKGLGDIEFLEIMDKAHQDFDSLTDPERIVLIVTYLSVFRVCEEAFIQFELGRLDKRYWDGMEKETKILLGVPSAERFWTMRHFLFDETFQQYVSSLQATDWKLE